jgi:hypothetical protein
MTRHLATFNYTVLFQAFGPGFIGLSRLRGVALLRETHSRVSIRPPNCVGLARTLSLETSSPDPPLTVRYIGWALLQLDSVSTPSEVHLNDLSR